MLQLAEVFQVGAVRVALGMEEVDIPQMQVLKTHHRSDHKSMEVELSSRHEGKVSEIAKRFEMLEGFGGIIGVEIGTVV